MRVCVGTLLHEAPERCDHGCYVVAADSREHGLIRRHVGKQKDGVQPPAKELCISRAQRIKRGCQQRGQIARRRCRALFEQRPVICTRTHHFRGRRL